MLVSLPPFRPPCPWPRAFALGALSLATLLVSASTRAETRKALLIANAEYTVDRMTLANPVHDAEKVKLGNLLAIRCAQMADEFDALGLPWIAETPEVKISYPSVFKIREWLEIRQRATTRG